MDEPNFSYRKHGHDPYYGKRILFVEMTGKDKYRVSESYLARNSEGQLGHIGKGVIWFLTYVANAFQGCFNPITEDELLWSPYHHAYFLKGYEEHFMFPIMVNEFYELKDGVKLDGYYCQTSVPETPNTRFQNTYRYF